MEQEKPIVLMVEDNAHIIQLNRMVLEREGYVVHSAENLEKARALVARLPHIDVAVLDIILPDGNGLAFAQELECPVLMLTSMRGRENIIEGLTGRADDYMTKPYRIEELSARIAVLLQKKPIPVGVMVKGKLQLDIPSGRAYVSGEDLLLQTKEFAVLLFLAHREGCVVSAETLYEAVWKLPMQGSNGALKSTVSRLRKKLLGSGYGIMVERGSGYYFGRE